MAEPDQAPTTETGDTRRTPRGADLGWAIAVALIGIALLCCFALLGREVPVDDSAKLYLESESGAVRAPVTIDNYEVVWTRGVAHEWTSCLQAFGRDGGPSRHGIFSVIDDEIEHVAYDNGACPAESRTVMTSEDD